MIDASSEAALAFKLLTHSTQLNLRQLTTTFGMPTRDL